MTASIAALNASPAVLPSSGTPASSSASDFPFTLHDLVSIVNPLQHIPIVATIYRAVTGDAIGPVERIAGDALYGGLWGFVSSVANVAFQEITGKDFGDTALAFLEDETGLPSLSELASNVGLVPAATQVASSAASSPPSASTASTAASAVAATASAAAAASAASLPSTNAVAATAPSTSAPAIVAGASVSPSANATTASAPTKTASGPPRQLQSATLAPQPQVSDQAMLALLASMNAKGIDPALSQRAMSAYSKSIALSPGETIPMF